MWAWLRGKGRVDYQTPPQEPARPLTLADVDIRLSELSTVPKPQRTQEYWEELDDLIEKRQKLAHPPAPVVPGRAEASIREYGENPW